MECAQVVGEGELGPCRVWNGACILPSKLEASINSQMDILQEKVWVFILQNEYDVSFQKVEHHDTSPLFVGFHVVC